MCGGIVAALNLGVAEDPGSKPRSLFIYQLAYNAGRICSYLLVGLLAGSLGAGLAQLGVSPLAGKLVAAAFMIALGLYLANWWRGLAVLEKLGYKLWHHTPVSCAQSIPGILTWNALGMASLWPGLRSSRLVDDYQ
jgi:sulfite exporter TauE/SafE